MKTINLKFLFTQIVTYIGLFGIGVLFALSFLYTNEEIAANTKEFWAAVMR